MNKTSTEFDSASHLSMTISADCAYVFENIESDIIISEILFKSSQQSHVVGRL